MNSNLHQPIVLLIDDDAVDIEAVQRRIQKRGLEFRVWAENDANRMLELLRGDSLNPRDRERMIVLLDINMPGMNGHQFLDAIRGDEKLKRTIVFVLSTSEQESDKEKAYNRNVAGYFVKGNLDGMLNTLNAYMQNVEFPPAV